MMVIGIISDLPVFISTHEFSTWFSAILLRRGSEGAAGCGSSSCPRLTHHTQLRYGYTESWFDKWHTKGIKISSLGENEQLAPLGDANFLELISWQHNDLLAHQWLISSRKISLSLAVPNSGSIVWSDLLKVWHSVSTSRSVYFSIVWVWNSLTQIDTVPVAIIYEVIWSPFCVIGKDSLQLHWQKTMYPGLGKFIYIYMYIFG